MGAKSSKPVAQAKYATRKFPSRPVGGSVPPSSRPTPTVSFSEPSTQPQSGASAAAPSQRPRAQQASFTKNDAIKADGMDPSAPSSSSSTSTFTDPNHHTNAAFSQRLRQMGVATPNPTLSNSSIVNSGPGSPTTPRAPRYPTAAAQQPSSSTKYSGVNPTSPSPATASPSRSTRPLPAAGGDVMSGTSRGNSTTLNALQVRAELAQRAQLEFEKGNRDREFLDVNTLRQLLVLLEARQKQQGAGAGAKGGVSMTDAEIERRLNLRAGTVKRLGEREGVFGTLSV